MAKTRIFTSFDYDHDQDLKVMLMGQAKNDDSPFELADWSLKDELSGDWKSKVRDRIKRIDQVVAICGEYTDSASGVSAELKIAQEEGKPYFLLRGRPNKSCKKPKTAKGEDKIYDWTWNNLKLLIRGGR